MKQKTNTALLIAILFILVVLAIACTKNTPPAYTGTGNVKLESSEKLQKFSSEQQLREYLKNVSENSGYSGYYGGLRSGGIMMDVLSESAGAPMSKTSADSSNTGTVQDQGASDYSQTNVQIAGVDEPDFVKNDNKFIYIISQDKLVIADAYPAENAKVISETKLNGTARNILVNKNKVIVFIDGYDYVYSISEYDYIPRPVSTQKTHILVYDTTDKSNPKLIKNYDIKGYYYDSRMIGDYVYAIVKDNVYYYNDIVPLPMVREASKGLVIRPDIYYFDNFENSYTFNTIASLNVFDDSEINAQTFMLGDSSTLYVSANNIYLAYQKSFPYYYYRTNNEDRFFKVVLPLLPSDSKEKINEIKKDENLDSYERWSKISSVLEDTYNNMNEDDKKELIGNIDKGIAEYEQNLEKERSKTVIHRISIDNGNIKYEGKGEVEGSLLNQFSMDEHNENLRVATTTTLWTNEYRQYNSVYVLNSKLETIGKLDNIAPDERIYSTRFIGDRLYMVTFKRIDPLFVIDLSNPEKPSILGELKIPGFSDYLHPYDETHIIGLGKETGSNEWGGISTKGLKLALFDVSDVSNPKQVSSYTIGEAGTDSEALYEHKAFLFDKNKNLLVIPVTEIKGKQYYDPKYGYYRQKMWQGAYVLGVNEQGFSLKGTISHTEGDEIKDYYWYGYYTSVRRSLFMDDTLYTISATKIKMNSLSDINKTINELDIPYDERYYGGPVLLEESVAGSSGSGGTVTVIR